jgi:hypothetical protein
MRRAAVGAAFALLMTMVSMPAPAHAAVPPLVFDRYQQSVVVRCTFSGWRAQYVSQGYAHLPEIWNPLAPGNFCHFRTCGAKPEWYPTVWIGKWYEDWPKGLCGD